MNRNTLRLGCSAFVLQSDAMLNLKEINNVCAPIGTCSQVPSAMARNQQPSAVSQEQVPVGAGTNLLLFIYNCHYFFACSHQRKN